MGLAGYQEAQGEELAPKLLQAVGETGPLPAASWGPLLYFRDCALSSVHHLALRLQMSNDVFSLSYAGNLSDFSATSQIKFFAFKGIM